MILRRLEMKDVDGMVEWMQDPEIAQYFLFDMNNASLEQQARKFILKAQEQFAEKCSMHYAIVDEADEYVGTISLKNIDWIAQNAEYAICLRHKAHGKGYGSAATSELLRIAFEELFLKRVYLNVLSHNQTAIRLYEKMGFTFEGEFRQHLFLRGQVCSLQWFAMLNEEYDLLKDK